MNMKFAAVVLAVVVVLANLPATNNTYQGFCTAAAISALPPTDSTPAPVAPKGLTYQAEVPMEAPKQATPVVAPRGNCANGQCYVPQRRGLFFR